MTNLLEKIRHPKFGIERAFKPVFGNKYHKWE